ncbi:MAG: acyl-CoA reductase, partial [Myxococcota bacterium]
TDAERVRDVAVRAAGTGPALRALGPEHIARALAGAIARVTDPTSPVGAHARDELARSTGLSTPMVDWALGTNVAPATAERLLGLHAPPQARAEPVPARLCVAVLAGNVFTAALRAVAVPLLHAVPVVAKASSRDDAFPRLLRRALAEVDPEVAPGLSVLTFAGGREALEDALFAEADVVQVHGSDATVARIRARLPATTRLLAHGHGLGVGWVPAAALPDAATARRVARAVALDVAAFDQRGCLSPHAVFVQTGGAASGADFAELLHAGLAELDRTLPRGALPTELGAAQVQWRGVAAARGRLLEGRHHAVSHEGEGPLRLSPGWRNVAVLDAPDVAAWMAQVRPLGVHLKAVGIAGDAAHRAEVAAALPAPLAPRLCAVGEMQTPPIDGLADGDPPWLGMIRWAELQ